MTNSEIAAHLEEIGFLLSLKGENSFKIKAFNNAANTIYKLDKKIEELASNNQLSTVKGIGKSIQSIIQEFRKEGRSSLHQELINSFPETLFHLFRVPGLAAKKIRLLYDELNITGLRELEYACNENRLITLKGFGMKTQQKILNDVRHLLNQEGFYLLSAATVMAEEYFQYLKRCPDINKVTMAGQIKRRTEVISTINLIITTTGYPNVVKYLEEFSSTDLIIEATENKILIQTAVGPMVSIDITTDKQFYFQQFYKTSSESHFEEMKSIASKRNYLLTQNGLYQNDREIVLENESNIYSHLELEFIPPELREGMGEVESAKNHSLPKLIQQKDLKGVLHNHSTWSDGSNSIEEMALAAKELGLQYIGISDHSKAAFYAGGLNEEQLSEQFAEIDLLNSSNKLGITILKGVEVDILSDGTLDLDDSILSQCDFVIASVHSQFNLDKEKMTKRIIRAIENRYVTMIGHPTGRLLLGRDGYEIDVDLFLQAVKANKKFVELNSNPHRLDLDWINLKKAKELEIKIAINPDAHRVEGLYDIRYGVDTARRGWITKEDCLNTLSINELLKEIKQ